MTDKPVKSVRWERKDGLKISSNLVAYGGRLFYNNKLTGDDNGVYICKVETYAGRIINREVFIGDSSRKTSGHRVRIVPLRLIAKEGGLLELECESGTLLHSVFFFFNFCFGQFFKYKRSKMLGILFQIKEYFKI